MANPTIAKVQHKVTQADIDANGVLIPILWPSTLNNNYVITCTLIEPSTNAPGQNYAFIGAQKVNSQGFTANIIIINSSGLVSVGDILVLHCTAREYNGVIGIV
jgi:hypothetical protein